MELKAQQILFSITNYWWVDRRLQVNVRQMKQTQAFPMKPRSTSEWEMRSLQSGVLPPSQRERTQEMLKILQIDRKYVRQGTDIRSSMIYVINFVKPCGR